MKLLEENQEENNYRTGVDKDFWDKTPKAPIIKAKNNKLTYHN